MFEREENKDLERFPSPSPSPTYSSVAAACTLRMCASYFSCTTTGSSIRLPMKRVIQPISACATEVTGGESTFQALENALLTYPACMI